MVSCDELSVVPAPVRAALAELSAAPVEVPEALVDKEVALMALPVPVAKAVEEMLCDAKVEVTVATTSETVIVLVLVAVDVVVCPVVCAKAMRGSRRTAVSEEICMMTVVFQRYVPANAILSAQSKCFK